MEAAYRNVKDLASRDEWQIYALNRKFDSLLREMNQSEASVSSANEIRDFAVSYMVQQAFVEPGIKVSDARENLQFLSGPLLEKRRMRKRDKARGN